jgi:hypothetical protein
LGWGGKTQDPASGQWLCPLAGWLI